MIPATAPAPMISTNTSASGQAEVDQRQRQQTAGDHLVALGEIEDSDGPVDEVEAEGHEGVDRPERDPFDGQCHVLHQAPPDSLVADRVTAR